MSHTHHIAHFATYTTPSYGPIALHIVLHPLRHCHVPQHCTLLHICQVMPRTYSIAPAVVPIGCIMGTQHCTPQLDHPPGHTSHPQHYIQHCMSQAHSIAYSTAHHNSSPSSCLIPTALHIALRSHGRVTSPQHGRLQHILQVMPHIQSPVLCIIPMRLCHVPKPLNTVSMTRQTQSMAFCTTSIWPRPAPIASQTTA